MAIAEGVLLIHNDQLEQAATRLENAIHDVRQAGVWNAYVSPSLAWLATALRCQGEREGIYAAAPTRNASPSLAGRRASSTSRFSIPKRLAACTARVRVDPRHVGPGPAIAPNVPQEPSGRQATGGRVRVRRNAQGISPGRTSLKWPELAVPPGSAEQALIQRVRPPDDATPAASSQAPSLSLIDRFDVVLETGRSIGSALSKLAVFRQVCHAASRLLRGENCFVLKALSRGEAGDDEQLELIPLLENTPPEYSETKARKAIRRAAITFTTDRDGHDADAPGISQGEGSTLLRPNFCSREGQSVHVCDP